MTKAQKDDIDNAIIIVLFAIFVATLTTNLHTDIAKDKIIEAIQEEKK